MCIIGEVQLFVEEYHPDTKLANNAVHIFNDNNNCEQVTEKGNNAKRIITMSFYR